MDAHETTIYYAVLITGVLLGCIILYFSFSVIRYQKRHLEVQRRLYLREIGLLEKDRTRISHDLHDELGPILAVTQMYIRTASDRPDRYEELLQVADDNLQTVLERLGGIASNLTPKSLHVKGLQFTLEHFIEQVRAGSKTRVLFCYGLKQDVPPEIGIHIYRIIQEVVHNALKHAEAELIEICIELKRKSVCIFCRDDGKGFPGLAAALTGGLGLESLQSRTAMVNGKMHRYSAAGKGTEYLFEIPFQQNEYKP